MSCFLKDEPVGKVGTEVDVVVLGKSLLGLRELGKWTGHHQEEWRELEQETDDADEARGLWEDKRTVL